MLNEPLNPGPDQRLGRASPRVSLDFPCGAATLRPRGREAKQAKFQPLDADFAAEVCDELSCSHHVMHLCWEIGLMLKTALEARLPLDQI